MKHISFIAHFLFCVFLVLLSQFLSSCFCCGGDEYISEHTHYISEVQKIKGNRLFIKKESHPRGYYNYHEKMLRYLFDMYKRQDTDPPIENHIRYYYPYTDKNNNTQYIQTPIENTSNYSFGSDIYREFFSGFLFVFTPDTEIMTIQNQSLRERDFDVESYGYVSTDESGYNLKGYYVKDKSYVSTIENFFESVQDTFNLTKVNNYENGPVHIINNLVLLDTIKTINIYCNSDYNDAYKKGSLLNDKMKIVYFNHTPFIQKWYKTATIHATNSDRLFAVDNTDNFTEEWLEDFNAKTNTNRLLHPEILLLCTENPAIQGAYSFTIEFIYNNGKKIIQETPPFLLLKEFLTQY